MADFFQNGTITTLHKLIERPIGKIEDELAEFGRQRPMALILPSLYSELEGDALPAIVEHLKGATYIADIIVGLDQADRNAGRRLDCPVLLMWSTGYLADKAKSPLGSWRKWADDVSEVAIDCGHFIVEEEPRLAADAMVNFFA